MSETRMFLVAIDPLDPTYDWTRMRHLLKTSPVFAAWWHHIPGCFLVTSAYDPDRITDDVRSVTGAAPLLVMETNPAHSEGWLPSRSWDWIRRREPEHAR